jgi:hypothetical protein
MSKFESTKQSVEGSKPPKELDRKDHRVRLPGFVAEETGLGDIVKHVSASIGIRPCGGCLRRAQALNNWVVFTPWKR